MVVKRMLMEKLLYFEINSEKLLYFGTEEVIFRSGNSTISRVLEKCLVCFNFTGWRFYSRKNKFTFGPSICRLLKFLPELKYQV